MTRKYTTVCYKVFGGKYLEGNQIKFLNLSAVFPDQKFTIIIKGKDRDKFHLAPEILFDHKTICVTSTFQLYKGQPEIVVVDPSQIVLKE